MAKRDSSQSPLGVPFPAPLPATRYPLIQQQQRRRIENGIKIAFECSRIARTRKEEEVESEARRMGLGGGSSRTRHFGAAAR